MAEATAPATLREQQLELTRHLRDPEGVPAPPDLEMAYITQIRDQFYPWMAADAVPVSEENFKAYGASTTPTVVLIDRAGLVRLYHPGEMTLEQIEPHVRAMVEGRATSAP